MGQSDDVAAMSDFVQARYASLTDKTAQAAEHYENGWRREPSNPELLERAVIAALLAQKVDNAVAMARSAAVSVRDEASFAVLTQAADEISNNRRRAASKLLASSDLGPGVEEVARGLQVWLTDSRKIGAAIERMPPEGAPPTHRMRCVAMLAQIASGVAAEAIAEPPEGAMATIRAPVCTLADVATAAEREDIDRATRSLETYVANWRGQGGDPTIDVLQTNGGMATTPALRRMSRSEGAAWTIYLIGEDVGGMRTPELRAVFATLALRMDPELEFVRLQLADALRAQGLLDLAGDTAAAVNAASPYWPEAQLMRIGVLLTQDRDAEALDVAHAVETSLNSREQMLQLGDIYRVTGALADAERLLTQVVDSVAADGDADWRPLMARAMVRQQEDRWPEAETDLVKALEISPDEPEVLNFLGYGWVDRGENVEQGLELIRKAVARKPRAGHIVDSLGWAYFRLGRYDDAIDQLQNAIEMEPVDPEITDHLGDAYWMAGRRDEAVFEWRHALTLNPPAPLEANLQDKIANGLPARAPSPISSQKHVLNDREPFQP
ncbi:MAG: tetratricopeptide repeat protein [Hyphomonadaceae bacterium]